MRWVFSAIDVMDHEDGPLINNSAVLITGGFACIFCYFSIQLLYSWPWENCLNAENLNEFQSSLLIKNCFIKVLKNFQFSSKYSMLIIYCRVRINLYSSHAPYITMHAHNKECCFRPHYLLYINRMHSY